MNIPKIRISKRKRILEMFQSHLGIKFSSQRLHTVFGSSFRARVSEINLDPQSPIVIHNKVNSSDEIEKSEYWSEARALLAALILLLSVGIANATPTPTPTPPHPSPTPEPPSSGNAQWINVNVTCAPCPCASPTPTATP